MRKFLLVLGIMALICSPAMAGKNANGALVVHTDDAHDWTFAALCDQFDLWYPDIACPDLNTRTDKTPAEGALLWFVAAFPAAANPGVTVIYFGHDHNLPQYYQDNWGFCGPTGTLEVPDGGWPEAPATAGNSVAFGSPIAGDHLFAFYYFNAYGFDGAYYCTGINPVGGYASFVDDSSPPVEDVIDLFGCVRWYAEGYNDCPSDGPLPGACCFEDGACVLTDDADICFGLGGWMWMGEGTLCDPNPCPQPGACCFDDGHCEYILEDWCTGTLFIPGSTCDPNPCPQPPEACCFDDGTCTFVPPEECNGTPWGYGTTCEPENPCPQPPTGACCDEETGACYVSTEADCMEELWIDGEVCDPNPCPQPPEGACCYGCEECVVLPFYECEQLADWYDWFVDEVCDPNPCPPIATETTTWGSIKADYK
jgi:hypothetical protein